MFNIFRRNNQQSEEDSPFVDPSEIMNLPPGSFTVYGRPLREPRAGEDPQRILSEFVYVRPGHQPPGKGWRKQ